MLTRTVRFTNCVEVINNPKPNSEDIPMECVNREVNRDENYDDILALLGFGRIQWTVLLVCGLNVLVSWNEILGINSIVKASRCDLDLSSFHQNVLGIMSLTGNISSSYFWRYLSDRTGRRSVLIASILITFYFSIMSMFAPNVEIFAVLRFLVGVSMGGITSVTYTYLCEFFTARYHTIVINYVNVFTAIAACFVPAVAWLISWMNWSIEMSPDFSFRPWRLLPLFYVLPVALSAWMLMYLPESPRILFTLGKHEEAYASLDEICRSNLKGKAYNEVVGLRVRTSEMLPYTKSPAEKLATSWSIFIKMWQETYPLLCSPLVRNFLICCIIISNIFMGSFGSNIWFPHIQSALSASAEQKERTTCEVMKKPFGQNKTVCNDEIADTNYELDLIYGAICVLGYAILCLFTNEIVRKFVLIACLAVAGIFGLSLLWLTDPVAIVISFSLFNVLSNLGMPIVNGIVVDLIPSHLCARAISICLTVGRLCSAISTNIVSVAMDHHCEVALYILSLLSIVSAILAVLLPTQRHHKKGDVS